VSGAECSKKSRNIGAIVGGTLGGVVVVAIVVMIIVIKKKAKRRSRAVVPLPVHGLSIDTSYKPIQANMTFFSPTEGNFETPSALNTVFPAT